jgi:hypothetical protein
LFFYTYYNSAESVGLPERTSIAGFIEPGFPVVPILKLLFVVLKLETAVFNGAFAVRFQNDPVVVLKLAVGEDLIVTGNESDVACVFPFRKCAPHLVSSTPNS